MAWNLTPAALTSSLGSVPLVAIGVWILLLRPRRRLHAALGTAAVGFGAGWGFHWLLVPTNDLLAPAWFTASGLGFVAGAVAAVLVPLWISSDPTRLSPAERWTAVAAGAAYTVASVSTTLRLGIRGAFPGILAGGDPPGWLYAWSATVDVCRGAWWAALLLLAFRFRRADPDAHEERRQVALMSSALLVWLIMRDMVFFGSAGVESQTVLIGFLLLGFTLLWLRNTQAPDGHLARNVAIFAALLALVARLWILWSGGFEAAVRSPVWGVLRLASVSILAYAILRHHLLGLDVTVRWTLSRSTLGAVFVAVFFVGTETAQQFFGETLGSTYVGIASAGALVFAMAPLQRAADRLAAKAVPLSTQQTARTQAVEAEAAFRAALQAGMRDGRLTSEEEIALARLADLVGLDAAAVTRIRHEVLGSGRRRASRNG